MLRVGSSDTYRTAQRVGNTLRVADVYFVTLTNGFYAYRLAVEHNQLDGTTATRQEGNTWHVGTARDVVTALRDVMVS